MFYDMSILSNTFVLVRLNYESTLKILINATALLKIKFYFVWYSLEDKNYLKLLSIIFVNK